MRLRLCAHCGGKLEARQRLYCSDAHRARAYRRRQAGLSVEQSPPELWAYDRELQVVYENRPRTRTLDHRWKPALNAFAVTFEGRIELNN